jgi:hypothetical protein
VKPDGVQGHENESDLSADEKKASIRTPPSTQTDYLPSPFYPTVFDHAADRGVDLMLAGHTHGGQVKLDFISPELAPKLFHTPYVTGWLEKHGSQLHVNRGIGTIGVSMLGHAP